MKQASEALIALLDSNQFIYADLYTFTLADGTLLRITSADDNLIVAGETFVAYPYLTRGTTKTVIGVQVDTLALSFMLNSSVLIGGIPLAQFVLNGGLDGAELRLERVFMPTWGDTSAGTLINFVGTVAESTSTRSQVDVTVNSSLDLLNIQLPRNVYQASCIHSLYDYGCTLNPTTWTVDGVVSNTSTTQSIVSNVTANSGYYDLGTISFTSGSNTGVTRSIKHSLVTGEISPSLGLPYAPQIGDTFTCKPGCDKQSATCRDKFSNVDNFRGYPTIPVPETLL